MLERPHAAADACGQAAAREQAEVAAHGHLRNRKELRKFRNADRIARLEQPQHVLQPIVLRKIRH